MDLGATWDDLGAVLGRSRAALGAGFFRKSEVSLGPSKTIENHTFGRSWVAPWATPKYSWGDLGASWDDLGASLATLGALLGDL